eukprot:TRINITY_DN39075_c0_g1_i1.p1 TRINITY_DN39075_c0_g1~~TRINITY_DN39075_c0_g1_i1.p1  ORF type:complete len:386 (-),score=22.76 TRINITY_DN39075_c0_g1_i1:219-1376(-)
MATGVSTISCRFPTVKSGAMLSCSSCLWSSSAQVPVTSSASPARCRNGASKVVSLAVVPGTVSKRTRQYELEILQPAVSQKQRQSVVREKSPPPSPTRRRRSEQEDGSGLPVRQIALIATDVDGTLLDSNHSLSERNERALLLAQEQGVKVVLSTGKTRGPWYPEIAERLKLSTPGVFLQGLLIYSADGNLLFERVMAEDVARQVINFAQAEGITLTAYCGDRILCDARDAHTDRLIAYGEPVPEAVGPMTDVVGVIPIHKLILMADDDVLAPVRPRLDAALNGRGSLVSSVPGMLEVLPPGASKAVGLSSVLEMLDIHPQQVLAAGDGENDIEMLQMAGLGVAMGNAGPSVKAVADYVSAENDQDGLAAAVERFALHAGFWCWD